VNTDNKKREGLRNALGILIVILVVAGFLIAFSKFIYFLGKEIVIGILIVFVYAGFIKVMCDEAGKWSLRGIMKAILTATTFILFFTIIIYLVKKFSCDFNFFNRYCL